MSSPESLLECPGALEDRHRVLKVDRKAQLALREVVSEQQWVEDVLSETPFANLRQFLWITIFSS